MPGRGKCGKGLGKGGIKRHIYSQGDMFQLFLDEISSSSYTYHRYLDMVNVGRIGVERIGRHKRTCFIFF